MRQSETFQVVLFSWETNDKIGTKRPAQPRLSIIRPLSTGQVDIFIRDSAGTERERQAPPV